MSEKIAVDRHMESGSVKGGIHRLVSVQGGTAMREKPSNKLHVENEDLDSGVRKEHRLGQGLDAV